MPIFIRMKIIFGIIFTYIYVSTAAILKIGEPLLWMKSKPHIKYIWLQGINQFIDHYNRSKGVVSPTFLWGDEIEYGILKSENGSFDISNRATDIREQLKYLESEYNHLSEGCAWQPEYGNWMIEAIPRDPYSGYVSDLLKVEKTMQLRRRRLHSVLSDNEIAPSITTFPMLGVDGYSHSKPALGDIANSKYISDHIINPHPRFTTLTKNIRSRRGSNVNITIPLDKNEKDRVHMDAMAFGMGCCCIQVTMQCRNEFESRLLADQLAILSPLFLALSAASPIFRGHLVASDTRWDVISQAVDDRTSAERGEIPTEDIKNHVDTDLVGNGVTRLNKSRYSSASLFIGKPQSKEDFRLLKQLNDIEASQDPIAYKLLTEGGVDEILADHVAHMFSRDPLVIFNDSIPPAVGDGLQPGLDHFESIQSTNWRTVRWKPPLVVEPTSDEPQKSAIMKRSVGPGWRVEFRPMEVQLTDFENAALAILVVLSARCLLAMGHSFYMPMSKVEENMKRASTKDAIINQKFHVRKNAFRTIQNHIRCDPARPLLTQSDDFTTTELSLDTFFNGDENFTGLIPAILQYLDALGCDLLTKGRLLPYLNLFQKRAAGTLPTNARWIRNFISSHPAQKSFEEENKFSSEVTPEAINDLLKICDDIGMGIQQCPDLVGDVFIESLITSQNEEEGEVELLPTDEERDFFMKKIENNYTRTENKMKRFIYPAYRPVSVCSGGDPSLDSSKTVHLDAALSTSLCG